MTKLPKLLVVGAWGLLTLTSGAAIGDSDTPWHIRNGELIQDAIISGEQFPLRQDPFSWTALGSSWQPNGWAFDLLSSYAYQFGWAGLAVLRTLLIGVLVLMLWRSTRGASEWVRSASVISGALFLIPFVPLRPQLASFILFLVALEILRKTFKDARWIPLLLAVIALWSNLHGAVLAGVGLLGLYLIGDSISLWKQTSPKEKMTRALTGILMLASTLFTPFGIDLWKYAFETRGDSYIITEWRGFSFTQPRDLLIIVLAITLVFLLIRFKEAKAQFGYLLMLIGAIALSFDAVRNQALLALVFTPVMSLVLPHVKLKNPWVSPKKLLVVIVISAALGVGLMNGSAFDITQPNSQTLPVAAAKQIPGECQLLNEYTFGGYLILARPDVLVSQDGRNDMYGSSEILRQERLLSSGSQQEIEDASVTCILARPGRDLDERLDDTWRLTHEDQLSELWVKDATS